LAVFNQDFQLQNVSFGLKLMVFTVVFVKYVIMKNETLSFVTPIPIVSIYVENVFGYKFLFHPTIWFFKRKFYLPVCPFRIG